MNHTFKSRIVLPAFAAAVFGIAACSGSEKKGADALAADSALARDLQLANRDTASQPQLADIPAKKQEEPAPAAKTVRQAPRVEARRPKTTPPNAVNPEPVSTKPAPPVVASNPPAQAKSDTGPSKAASAGPGAGAGKEALVGVIGAGTTLNLLAGQKVCTNTSAIGDRFTATLNEAVQGTNGASIPSGATAVLEVTTLKRAEGARDSVILRFDLKSIAFGGKTYPATGELAQVQVDRMASTKNNDGKKVATGAAIGAIAGQIFGRKTKSTVIGAAAGAAAGVGVAMATAKYEGCVPLNGKIGLRLTQPISIQM